MYPLSAIARVKGNGMSKSGETDDLREISAIMSSLYSSKSNELISRAIIVTVLSIFVWALYDLIIVLAFMVLYLMSLVVGIYLTRKLATTLDRNVLTQIYISDIFRYFLYYALAGFMYLRPEPILNALAFAMLAGTAFNALTKRNHIPALTLIDSVCVSLALLWFGWGVSDLAAGPGERILIFSIVIAVTAYFNACLFDALQSKSVLDMGSKEREDANYFEAIGRLTAGIAHDFNNILTAVMGNLELLQEVKDPVEKDQLAVAARDSAHRASIVTAQLLAFSRQMPLLRKTIDLPEFFDDFAPTVAAILPTGVTWERDLHEGLWPVEVDPDQLTAALINIVENARDAMPDGGTFTISARNQIVTSEPGGRLQPGPYVAFDLKDTGVGISPAILPRIFDPFFTTKPPGKSSGLGLSMAKGFAAQSGGSLRVDSVEGQGTTFMLVLPAVVTE